MARQKMTILTNVREWYTKTYPQDTLGERINPQVTFCDVMSCLLNEGSIYDTLDVSDSLIRERIFTQTAKAAHVDYDTIYHLWLFGRESLTKQNSKKRANKAA